MRVPESGCGRDRSCVHSRSCAGKPHEPGQWLAGCGPLAHAAGGRLPADAGSSRAARPARQKLCENPGHRHMSRGGPLRRASRRTARRVYEKKGSANVRQNRPQLYIKTPCVSPQRFPTAFPHSHASRGATSQESTSPGESTPAVLAVRWP